MTKHERIRFQGGIVFVTDRLRKFECCFLKIWIWLLFWNLEAIAEAPFGIFIRFWWLFWDWNQGEKERIYCNDLLSEAIRFRGSQTAGSCNTLNHRNNPSRICELCSDSEYSSCRKVKSLAFQHIIMRFWPGDGVYVTGSTLFVAFKEIENRAWIFRRYREQESYPDLFLFLSHLINRPEVFFTVFECFSDQRHWHAGTQCIFWPEIKRFSRNESQLKDISSFYRQTCI